MAETRREREWSLQNRFGPIVGISELSDRDFDELERMVGIYETWKRDAGKEPLRFSPPSKD